MRSFAAKWLWVSQHPRERLRCGFQTEPCQLVRYKPIGSFGYRGLKRCAVSAHSQSVSRCQDTDFMFTATIVPACRFHTAKATTCPVWSLSSPCLFISIPERICRTPGGCRWQFGCLGRHLVRAGWSRLRRESESEREGSASVPREGCPLP